MGDLFSQYHILGAFWVTIQLTFWSAIGALVIGTLVAVMRVSPVPILRGFGTSYVNVFRNTPLTVIMVFASLGLWQTLGLTISGQFKTNNLWLAVIALSVYHAAFVCESLRSGVNTVQPGQAEAARSIGLTFMQNIRYVVMPQAFRGAVTPLGNTLIALIKNTTVASVIGVAEASYVMADALDARPDVLFLIFGMFAIGFVILTLPVGLLISSVSERLQVKR